MAQFIHITDAIQTQTQLQSFSFPDPTSAAIPWIQEPKSDGLSCLECSYIARQNRKIQEHCRIQHRWINPIGRFGISVDIDVDTATNRVNRPWRINVRCQQLFRNRRASGWFEVERNITVEEPITSNSNRFNQLQQRISIRLAGSQPDGRTIQETDQKKEPNAWLGRVGWATHLNGIDPQLLHQSIQPPAAEESDLQHIYASIERIVDIAMATAVPGNVARSVLFEIGKRTIYEKPHKPYTAELEPETQTQYKRYMQQVICYIVRSQSWNDELVRYKLTHTQELLIERLEAEVEEILTHGLIPESEVQLDRTCLDFIISMLDHQLDSDYDSGLLSALAVMGITEDGGWMTAINYTPIYSGIIKIIRALVIYQSVLERQEEIEKWKSCGLDENQAQEKSKGLFRIVRSKVSRFMTIIHENSEPTPMDWIFESRSYGLKIRYTTVAEGKISWKKDEVRFQKFHCTMGQLIDSIHNIVSEAEQLLGQLLLYTTNGTGIIDISQIPHISISKLEDDCSEESMGYSFLKDRRNMWPVEGKTWLLERICSNQELYQQWIIDTDSIYRPEAVRKYGTAVESFLEKLLLLIHMTAGQPARSTEVIGLRFENTAQAGVRNIFIQDGMVSCITAYHKNFRSFDQAKIIHRFLPESVGRLLVWYLWLVLPFWQQVQLIGNEGGKPSSFLFADEIIEAGRLKESEVEDPEESEMEDRDPEDPDPEDPESTARSNPARLNPARSNPARSNPARLNPTTDIDTYRSKPWSSDRMRRILQQHSLRLLGTPLNIIIWRHVAIAISNRFLNSEFGKPEDEEIDVNEWVDDLDSVNDNPWDLQAGHGTHVAGMIYARELQQGNFNTASKRSKFCKISRRWHRFLGFNDPGIGLGSIARFGGPGSTRGSGLESTQQSSQGTGLVPASTQASWLGSESTQGSWLGSESTHGSWLGLESTQQSTQGSELVPASTQASWLRSESTQQSTQGSGLVPASTQASWLRSESTQASWLGSESTQESGRVPESTQASWVESESTQRSRLRSESTQRSRIIPESTQGSWLASESTRASWLRSESTQASWLGSESTQGSWLGSESTPMSGRVPESTQRSERGLGLTQSTQRSGLNPGSTRRSETIPISTQESELGSESTPRLRRAPDSTPISRLGSESIQRLGIARDLTPRSGLGSGLIQGSGLELGSELEPESSQRSRMTPDLTPRAGLGPGLTPGLGLIRDSTQISGSGLDSTPELQSRPRKRKKEAYETEREYARFHRFKKLYYTDLQMDLISMMGPAARFRSGQLDTIQSIVKGEPVIIQIVGTGGGKSLSFMLPAFSSDGGTTIVVVPLVALREDMARRCEELRIDTHIWDSKVAARAASIIFVTPESVQTEGFQLFVNRLKERQQLDRIVVDECHMLLDSNKEFRPKMRELGHAIRQIGTQMVFLTATLAPCDEAEFFDITGLQKNRVRIFRSSTIRKNIRYQSRIVKMKEIEETVIREVRNALTQHLTGKIIVYSNTIERAERLGSKLKCPVYHSKVGNMERKRQLIKRWLKEERVVVATNALGVGIDVSNIRTVIHAGSPRRLRDYAQESGRAGRDGCSSEAILIDSKEGKEMGYGRGGKEGKEGKKREKEGFELDENMKAFIYGYICKRVILDRVMDGRMDRMECEEGEEKCDVCQGVDMEDIEDPVDDLESPEGPEDPEDPEGPEGPKDSAGGQAVSQAFRGLQREEVWGQNREFQDGREAGRMLSDLKRFLDEWVGVCVVCRLDGSDRSNGSNGIGHRIWDCEKKEELESFWKKSIRIISKLKKQVLGQRNIAAYSGCFDCGVPQVLCGRWIAQEKDMGSFQRRVGGICGYKGVIFEVIGGILGYEELKEEANGIIEELMEREGLEYEGKNLYKWLGRLIRFGGVEGWQGSNLAKVFVMLCRLEEESRGGEDDM